MLVYVYAKWLSRLLREHTKKWHQSWCLQSPIYMHIHKRWFYTPMMVTLSTVCVCTCWSLAEHVCTHIYKRIPLLFLIVVLMYSVELRAHTIHHTIDIVSRSSSSVSRHRITHTNNVNKTLNVSEIYRIWWLWIINIKYDISVKSENNFILEVTTIHFL